MKNLEGKTAVITGGARGMGEATVRVFAEAGANVVIADLLESEGNQLADELGAKVKFQRLDVTSEESWENLIAFTHSEFGCIDALVNNAGIVLFKAVQDTEKADFEKVLSVNLVGTFLGIKLVGGEMVSRGAGSIVNISSVDGFESGNSRIAYSASKFGVRGLTRAAAMEYGPKGVRVNSVHPGGINTVMANPLNMTLDEINQQFAEMPLQRIGEPEEVARVSLFLCSDDASYVTGEEIRVDGGMLTGRYTMSLPGAPSLNGS